MTLAILSHNKPIQNIWISALEPFLLRKQVTVTDPTNVQKRRRQREHCRGEGHSSQIRTGICGAIEGRHFLGRVPSSMSPPNWRLLSYLLLLLAESWHLTRLYSLAGYSCGRSADAVILSKRKWRGHRSHLRLPFHCHLIHLFPPLLSPPIPCPANNDASKQIRPQMSHTWSIYTRQKAEN